MIFVTVGHQMPFDRLIRAVDEWAGLRHRSDVFAQIGEGDYRPRNLEWCVNLPPEEFRRRVCEASAVIAHAGTGTIIDALRLGRPLLVLPRLARLGETRNDHQVPTARHFANAGHLLAAFDEAELMRKLDEVETFRPQCRIVPHASPQLIQTLREFAMK